jgi:hypothetical protein
MIKETGRYFWRWLCSLGSLPRITLRVNRDIPKELNDVSKRLAALSLEIQQLKDSLGAKDFAISPPRTPEKTAPTESKVADPEKIATLLGDALNRSGDLDFAAALYRGAQQCTSRHPERLLLRSYGVAVRRFDLDELDSLEDHLTEPGMQLQAAFLRCDIEECLRLGRSMQPTALGESWQSTFLKVLYELNLKEEVVRFLSRWDFSEWTEEFQGYAFWANWSAYDDAGALADAYADCSSKYIRWIISSHRVLLNGSTQAARIQREAYRNISWKGPLEPIALQYYFWLNERFQIQQEASSGYEQIRALIAASRAGCRSNVLLK